MSTDKFTINAVVVGLIALGLAVIVGAVVLTLNDKQVSDALWGLAGTAVGALGSLLARTTTSDGEPTPVNVVNVPADPVPVDTTPAKKAAPKRGTK